MENLNSGSERNSPFTAGARHQQEELETAPLLLHCESQETELPENEVLDITMPILFAEVKHLFWKGWPLVVSFFIQNSIYVAPVFSLGHLGTQYLAAIALTTMFCK
jgi:hypothetical protein